MSKKTRQQKPLSGERATQPLSRHDCPVVRIDSLSGGGQGVARINGLPVFVSRVAPGDLVEIELFDVRRGFAFGAVKRLVEPSGQRVEPLCKLFKVCGGCQWQHIAYEHQLSAKADIVRQALKHIGGLDTELVRETISSDQPFFYRNKVQFPVAQKKAASGAGKGTGAGRIIAGYYQEGSHELVNIKHCPVQPEPLDALLAAAKEALERHCLSAYDESSHTGLVRHIVARYSFAFSHILLTLVVNRGSDLPGSELAVLSSAAHEIMQAVPGVKGVCVNFNSSRGNRIMGQNTRCLCGEAHVVEILKSRHERAPQSLREGISFQLSANSFFPVNTSSAVTLLDQVLEAALDYAPAAVSLSGEQPHLAPVQPLTIVDAYAGVGTMALWLSFIAERVIAVEEEPAAVADGMVNRQLNGISNVEFRQGKVENVVAGLLAEGLRPDLLVLDPPRKGVEADALAGIAKLEARRIIYVSCNPATLARDLKILAGQGYALKNVQPVDMFPQTHHIESVTILDRSS